MGNILCLYDLNESEALHVTKASVILASVKATKVKSPYVFKNDVVRFQFLEHIMRCAIRKYFDSDIVETEV